MMTEGDEPIYKYTSPSFINQEKIAEINLRLDSNRDALKILNSGHTGLESNTLAAMISEAESRIAADEAEIQRLSSSDETKENTTDIKTQISTLETGIASLKQELFALGGKQSETTPPAEILALLQEINEKESELERLVSGEKHE